jgi:hypothetical protein
VDQIIRGRVVQPVYAFDKLLIPVGTEVSGRITRIEPVSAAQRTLAVLDANFTPLRAIDVTFTELILADGKHIQIQTTVTPGSGQVIRFLVAADGKDKKGIKDAASEKALEAKEEFSLAKLPGKNRRAEVAEELRAHLEDLAEEVRSEGYDEKATARIVRMRFGEAEEVAGAFSSV